LEKSKQYQYFDVKYHADLRGVRERPFAQALEFIPEIIGQRQKK
jgi:hypothetical protein